MQRTFLKTLAILLLLNLAAYAQQSLGEIARQYKEKLQAEEAAGTGPKMYTNQDIPPADQVGTPEPSDEAQPAAHQSYRTFDDRGADHRFAQQRDGAMWRRDIVMQENRVAGLQMRIDQLNAMMHSPYGTAQYEGPYSRGQARAQQRLEQMQQALDHEKLRLEEMQDAARHAVMNSPVYDP